MKKTLLLVVATLFLAASAFAQSNAVPGAITSGSGDPSGNCLSNAYNYLDYSNSDRWYCPSSAAPFALSGGNVVARTLQKAETGAADAALLSYTPSAAAASYKVCETASVSAATSGVVGFTVSWTDSNGNAQANIAQSLTQAGTAAPALTFTTSAASNYGACLPIDINNAAAAIVVKWVGGGTNAAKATATITRLN